MLQDGYQQFVPQAIKRSIDDYVKHGYEPGGFVMAVLENNLVEALGRADANSFYFIKEIVGYIYNDIPGSCWGSKEKVKNWLNKFKTTEHGYPA